MNIIKRALTRHEYNNIMAVLDKTDQEAESLEREECILVQTQIEKIRQRIKDEYANQEPV